MTGSVYCGSDTQVGVASDRRCLLWVRHRWAGLVTGSVYCGSDTQVGRLVTGTVYCGSDTQVGRLVTGTVYCGSDTQVGGVSDRHCLLWVRHTGGWG